MLGKALETESRLTFKELRRVLVEGMFQICAGNVWNPKRPIRYASIGAVLVSKEVADGVRDNSGL